MLQGMAVSLIVVILPCAGNPDFLKTPQAWILVATGIIASLFQPVYNPFRKAPDSRDRGTASQIIWSIYLTQLAVILEASYVRYPESVLWNTSTTVSFLLIIAGLFIRTWAVFTLGKFFTWHIASGKDQTVIVTGPYAYIRHPGYSGAFLTYASTAIFLHSWYSLIPSSIILWMAFVRRIRHEENELKEKIGEPYTNYCLKVKRLIPFIW
jgi:protein-S-isoprenylcysteine O-methyltransferase